MYEYFIRSIYIRHCDLKHSGEMSFKVEEQDVIYDLGVFGEILINSNYLNF